MTIRSLLSQGAIGLAICLGAWFVLVKPKIDECARLNQTIQKQSSAAAGPMNQQTIEAAAQRMTVMRARLSEVNSRNALAGDSSRLYGLVMDLAETHGVLVHNLQPGGVSTGKTGAAATEASMVDATRLNMSVEGPYESVASFFEAVCNLDAYIRPVALQLFPSRNSGRTTVEANFGCDVLKFAVSGALADALPRLNQEGGGHGRP